MPTPLPTSACKLRQLAERDQRVFASYPLVGRYFPASAIEDARQRLSRAIDRGDGPGLVIGAPGSGKSLLLQVLAAQYHERFDVVLPACARLCTRRALLQSILFELGLPYKMRDEGELRLSLLDHLLSAAPPLTPPQREEGLGEGGLLLLVDEAQALSIALLDELRVMTNLVRGGAPRVRLVLAGSAALEESFAHPELESFSQRLSARCYLAPLNRDEMMQYIRAQIAASGSAPDDIFTPDAWAAIFDATDGVPRLVNQLCDRALHFAARDCSSHIDRDVVQKAWSDIQQLPTPWDTPPGSATEAIMSEVVEFGGLSDEILAEDRYDIDATFDVEPTELDDDAGLDAKTQADEVRAEAPTAATVAADPFAEKFEEEEVLLDNFAAWDDMFRREMPRVENRRDPGFATLVQAAIEASPMSASNFAVLPAPRPAPEFDSSTLKTMLDECSYADLLADDELPVESPTGRPRLRLADVSDIASSENQPLAAMSSLTISNREVAVEILPARDSYDDATNRPPAEDPVLVIEDENTPSPAKPPVRREDYRHLFSRLRSG